MRDEIIVAGDESDAKRQPSREPQSSPSVVCLDGTTIPPTEPAGVSDQYLIPLDGEDTLSEYDLLCPGDIDRAAPMPPPGWPSDDQRRWKPLQRQIPLYTSVFGRNQLERPSSFRRLFVRTTGDGSPHDDASSVDSRQDDIKPTLAQQAPLVPVKSKSSRASATSRRSTKQASVSKSSHKRSRKGASRDDHDQEGDCPMGEADVPKKQEDNGPWVCPFFRKDPTRHMDCITLTLNRIQDVKQHLTRRHTAELYCSTCFQEFQLHQEWEQHTQRRNCTRRPCPPHRVTPQAQDRLKVRVDRTMTAAEQWYEIWKILFEDEKPPHSPQQGSVIGEVISIIRDCWHEERGQILSELVRSEGISENEAGVLGMLLPGLLDRVEARVDPPQRDSGVFETPSNTDSSTPYITDQTGQTLDIGGSAVLAPPSDYSATPKLSKSPSPTTPILPDISGSNFQSLKLEPFTYDPSLQEDSFDQMMEQPYAASADNDELAAAVTFSGQLEGNCLETRGLLGYMDPVIDYHGLGVSAFASSNPVWGQYPGHIDMFDGNDVTDLPPMVNQPLKQRCQGDPNIR